MLSCASGCVSIKKKGGSCRPGCFCSQNYFDMLSILSILSALSIFTVMT
jgi:hypothetical protein